MGTDILVKKLFKLGIFTPSFAKTLPPPDSIIQIIYGKSRPYQQQLKFRNPLVIYKHSFVEHLYYCKRLQFRSPIDNWDIVMRDSMD